MNQNQNLKKKNDGKVPTDMEQVVEKRRVEPSFNNGFDSVGGGVGYPQSSKPPPKPKPAATPGTNKKGHELHQMTN